MAVCGLKKYDFVVFTPKGIYVVNMLALIRPFGTQPLRPLRRFIQRIL